MISIVSLPPHSATTILGGMSTHDSAGRGTISAIETTNSQSFPIYPIKMSSGFVSAGTNYEPVERDDDWQRVQRELEEERKRKADLGKQDGGKSLFDVLEQNKSKLFY